MENQTQQLIGFPLYEIHRNGDVYRKERNYYEETKSGKIMVRKKLKATKDVKDGYYRVRLKSGDGKWNYFCLHRVVGFAFNGLDIVGNRSFIVCHIDDNKEDNSIENLYIGTQNDNIEDLILKNRLLGLYRKGKIKIIE